MADQWVSIRALLPSDPKTISVARTLCESEQFITAFPALRNACSNATDLRRAVIAPMACIAFLKIWAVGNSRGRRDGTDVILTHCDYEALDEIGELPGIARAMQSVGWAYEEEWQGVKSVRLPNFVEYNITAEDRSAREKEAREQNRIRQQRYRDRNSNGHPNGNGHDPAGHNASNGYVTPNNASTEQDSTEQDSTGSAINGYRGGVGGAAFAGYPQAFLIAWSLYPEQGRVAKERASVAWQAAVERLAALHNGHSYKAEDWLVERIRAYAKSPVAQTRFCKGIAGWLEEARYDDAEAAWQDAAPRSAKKASPSAKAIKPPKRPDGDK